MGKATQIYRNGTILTMDSRGSVVSALAVEGNVVLAVGTDDDVMAHAGPDTVVTDLRGRTMLPGFIDGHSHFVWAGLMFATQLDLSSPPVGKVKDIAEIRDLLKEKAASTPKGEWILGYGYDDTALADRRHPLASDMDDVTPDHPVLLRHVSGHLCSCNSRALALVGYDRNTPDPLGGIIRRDGHGNPNGVLEEPPAMNPVAALLPEASEEDWMRSIVTACDAYTAKGVTSAQDGFTQEKQWAQLRKAHEKGLLRNRVQILPGLGCCDLNQFTSHASGTPLTADRKISLGAVKHLVDGSLQCYTGCLSNPYHKIIYDLPDGPMWRGYIQENPEGFIDRIVALHRQGWQIAIHGNGDEAIQLILDAYEEAQKRYPRADARHIIIHCQTVREDQLDRIKRLGVVPSFFVVHTYFWGDRHRDIFLGPDRAKRISPLRSALKRGILFSNHNDTFVTPIDPLLSVWSAVNRITSSGQVLGEEYTISVMDALRSVTSWAAYQACEETSKGSLEPGKLADMVVLGDNPRRGQKGYPRHSGAGDHRRQRTRIRVAGIALPETRRHGGAPSRLLRRVSPAPVVADTHNFDGCLTKRGIHGSVILSVSGCIVLDRYAAHARDVNPCQGAVVPEAAVSFLPYRWPHRVRADQP